MARVKGYFLNVRITRPSDPSPEESTPASPGWSEFLPPQAQSQRLQIRCLDAIIDAGEAEHGKSWKWLQSTGDD